MLQAEIMCSMNSIMEYKFFYVSFLWECILIPLIDVPDKPFSYVWSTSLITNSLEKKKAIVSKE